MPSWKHDFETFRSNNHIDYYSCKAPDFANFNYPSPSMQLRAKQLLQNYYSNISSVTHEKRLFHPYFFGIGHFSELIHYSMAERLGILESTNEFKIPKITYSSIPFSLLKLVENYCIQKVSLLPWISLKNFKMSEFDFLRYTHREQYSDAVCFAKEAYNYPPVGKLIFSVNARASDHDFNEVYDSARISSTLSQDEITRYSNELNRPYVPLGISNIPKQYVVLHLRTPRDYLCYRDVDHANYNNLVDSIYLLTGLPVVRIGLGPALIKKDHLFDFNDLFLQDDLIGLVFNCEYYIGNPSGPSILPALMKKKTLIIDNPTSLNSLTTANLSYTMIHVRNKEFQPSSSEELIIVFNTFINNVRTKKSPYTLNGVHSDITCTIVNLLENMYHEKIKNAHFISSEQTMRRYIDILKCGDFTYH